MARAPVVRGAGGPTSLHWVFPYSSSCMVASPGGCLTSLRSLGRRGHQTAVAKISMFWTSEQNSTPWGGSLWRICCRHKTDKRGRGTRLRQFTPGDKVLVLLPTSSSKLLAKWQGPFVVTRRVGERGGDYEVKRTDRGDACQIYPPQPAKTLE